MPLLPLVASLWRNLLQRERLEQTLSEEVDSYLDMLIGEKMKKGLNPQEARRAALIELGGAEQIKERVREVRMGHQLETLVQDLRYAVRMLRRNFGLTILVVAILALGIGANTAIFTLLNAVIVKPLPVKNPEQLVLFNDSASEGTSLGDPPREKWELFSYSSYEFFRNNTDSFQELCAFRSGESRLNVWMEGSQAGEAAQRAQGHLVSGTFFATLGVSPILGRTLRPEDDVIGASPAAVISYAYWKGRCGGDSSVVNKSVMLNGKPFTIVGVMPQEFFGVRVRRSPDFWLPLAFQPEVEMQESYLNDSNAYWLNIMGRLKPGSDIQQARSGANLALQQFLTGLAGSELTEDRQSTNQASYVDLAYGGRGISGLRSYYSEPLQMLMAVVAVILLIACANVGNLLLSRSVSRRREILIRLSMGATRARLVRQLLTESLLLASLGGSFGVLFSLWGARALATLVAPTSPLDLSPDTAVLGFTIGVSLLSGFIFGLAPALGASRVDLSSGLKEKSAPGGGRLRFGMASALVISQVALSLVMLVGAGLFARSLLELQREDLGFNRDNVLLMDIEPRLAGYKPAELNGLYRQLLDRVGALPGVSAATMASYSPMSGSSRTSNVSVEGYTPEPGENPLVSNMLVGPGYGATLGLPLLLGREIGLQDTAGSRMVAVVNEAFSDYFFPGQNPVGRRFTFGSQLDPENEIEIVGVIGNAKYDSARRGPKPCAYRPILQVQNWSAYSCNLEMRTAGEPLASVPAVRAAIAQVDSKLTVSGVTSLSKQFESALGQERMMAQLVSFFGLLALVLACVGLYGVMAHGVVRRTNEIGIRMALGAQRRDILWMVLYEAISQVLIGVAIGIPLAFAGARLIASMLFGVTGFDPVTISIAVVVLVTTAIVAGYLPARNATRVDPMVALRYE
ncbi:MAG TPA: ABC transporter permease [Blastocatellia bacterium]|nr:ABC transporter permease [Blastocatellia bacterium]